MMFLVPAVGVPSELMLQDTLKSAIVAFGTLGAALLFFWQQRNRTEPLLWHGLVWLPLALMSYALGSMVWSHTYLAGVDAIRWFLLTLLLWLGENTLTKDNIPTLLWGIHWGTVVASMWVALQFWFDLQWFPQGPNPASTFYNRNFFAEYVVCALPFSVGLLASMRGSRYLYLVALSVALNTVALLMTGTRSALMALLVLLPVLLVFLVRYRAQFAFTAWSRTQRGVVVAVLALGVGGMGGIPSNNPQVTAEGTGSTALQRSFVRAASVAQVKEYTEGSFSIRSLMWKATARMAIANPWTGVGAGAWEAHIPLYQRAGTLRETDYYAHNEFLQLLSEYGAIVGGLFWATLFAYGLLALEKTRRLSGEELPEAPIRGAAIASLLVMLLVSNAGFPWHLAGVGALFALNLGLLAGSDTRLGMREAFFSSSVRWRPTYTRTALVLVSSSLLLATYLTCQAAIVEYKLTRSLLYLTGADHVKLSGDALTQRQAKLLQDVSEAIAIHPHYRKLTPVVADHLAKQGDWANAVWIWESVVASRPYVPAFWYNLTKGHLRLGQYAQCKVALDRLVQLQPDAPGAGALEAILLSRTGQVDSSVRLIKKAFAQGTYDYDMVLAGFTIGYESQQWALAIQALELRLKTWPSEAPDAYFKLGHVYAETALRDDKQGLAAFRAGLRASAPEKQEKYRQQVPERFRHLL
jgi:O-antigen ligase